MSFKSHDKAINMRKIFAIPMLLLSASFILPSCEKIVLDYSPQMEIYYIESQRLPTVTIDSVKAFSSKIDRFATKHPIVKEHEKYPLILENIKAASIRFVITCDTTWDGHIYMKF